jgi:hypothetical protein
MRAISANRGIRVLLLAALCLVSTPQLALAASSAQASVLQLTPAPKRPHPHRKPWPITLTVQTVPALPGVRLRFDDRIVSTDAQGRAAFTEEHNFAPHLLTLLDTSVRGPGHRLHFARWAGQRDPDQAFRTTVSGLPMRMSYTVTAAFAVQRLVAARLVDERGQRVDPARVSALTVRTSRGDVVSLPASGRIWLDAVVPVYRNSAIELQTQTYSLISVVVGGTNTVDSGRQKFQPATMSNPVFRTKFFRLTVVAHDLLFKSSTGEAARVTFADGTVHTLQFGASGRVILTSLPRGTYQVTLSGGGTPLPAELVLSRDTTVDVPVATHRDYGAIGLLLAGLGLGLLVIGRGRHNVIAALRGLKRRNGRPELA